MKPKDIFSLAVRLLGLVFVYLGFKTLPVVFSNPNTLIIVACYFAAAWWLIGGAQLLVSRAYPEASSEPQRGTDIPGGVSAKADA